MTTCQSAYLILLDEGHFSWPEPKEQQRVWLFAMVSPTGWTLHRIHNNECQPDKVSSLSKDKMLAASSYAAINVRQSI